MVQVRCYAKINLELRVLGNRPDGYHELRTVFQAVSLYDTLEIRRERGRKAVEVECNWAELAGPQNLAARAAEMMARELGLSGGLRLRLQKRIPIGAGLGGGSSDAAAALRGVARLAGRNIPLARLLAMATDLGADVPFFLLGGKALGLGRGTEVYPLPDERARPLVLVYPGLPVNTGAAYKELDRSLTDGPETDKICSFCASVGERGSNRPQNDFEPVVFSTYPNIARLKSFLIRAGASPALLSGSGSAVYGFFASRRKAEQGGSAIRRKYPGYRVWVVRTVSRKECERAVSVEA